MQAKITTAPTETIDRQEFMRQVGMSIGGILLLNCLGSCEATEIPDPQLPGNNGKLDFTLNISSNPALNSAGGAVINSTDNVIVARTADGGFIAVQSNCTHQNSQVAYRLNEKAFVCTNPNQGHGSKFNEAGGVINGPASTPLKKYRTSFDATANTVRVFE